MFSRIVAKGECPGLTRHTATKLILAPRACIMKERTAGLGAGEKGRSERRGCQGGEGDYCGEMHYPFFRRGRAYDGLNLFADRT